jgi:hypothetical protein
MISLLLKTVATIQITFTTEKLELKNEENYNCFCRLFSRLYLLLLFHAY